MRPVAAASLIAFVFSACTAPSAGDDAAASDTATLDRSAAADTTPHDATDADANALDAARDTVATDAGDGGLSMSDEANDTALMDAAADAPFADASDGDALVDSTPPIDVGGDANADSDAPSCVPLPESCFNGSDDDCDGLVDCADPDCTPTAECVPDPGTAMAGTVVAVGASCPSAFGASTLGLLRGLDAPATCTGCTCSGAVGCSTVINLLGTSCSLPAINAIGASTLSCNFLAGIGSAGGLEVDPFTTLAYCNSSGSPAIAPLSWSEQQTFCATTSHGGGCATGMACVPVVPSGAQHCVTASDTSSCASGYTAQSGGPWYTNVTDGRSCGSTCTCTATGAASCGSSYVALYSGTGTCNTPIGMIASGTTDCTIPAGTARAQVQLQGTVTPSCSPDTTAIGTATPTGATTVCCE